MTDNDDILKDDMAEAGEESQEMDVIKSIWDSPALQVEQQPKETPAQVFNSDLFGKPAEEPAADQPGREEIEEIFYSAADETKPEEREPEPASREVRPEEPEHNEHAVVDIQELRSGSAEPGRDTPVSSDFEEITLQTSAEHAYLTADHPEIDATMDSLALSTEGAALIEKTPPLEPVPPAQTDDTLPRRDAEIKVMTDDDLRHLFSQIKLGPAAHAPEAREPEEHEYALKTAANEMISEIEDKLMNLEHEVEVGDFQAVGAAKKGDALLKTREQVEKLDTVNEDFLSVETMRKLFQNVNMLIDLVKDLTERVESMEKRLEK